MIPGESIVDRSPNGFIRTSDRAPRRIISAHFQRENLAGIFHTSAADRHARLVAAGEIDSVDSRMRRKRASGFAPALKQIEHACRQSSRLPQLGINLPDKRRLFTGLEN